LFRAINTIDANAAKTGMISNPLREAGNRLSRLNGLHGPINVKMNENAAGFSLRLKALDRPYRLDVHCLWPSRTRQHRRPNRQDNQQRSEFEAGHVYLPYHHLTSVTQVAAHSRQMKTPPNPSGPMTSTSFRFFRQ
jgi:hypothetical protein